MTDKKQLGKENTMCKVTKTQARKMFYSGVPITLIPCKVSERIFDEHPHFISPIKISLLECGDIDPITLSCIFDTKVNEFIYYNCNNELGTYPHYYVDRVDKSSYDMCEVMCQ